ncbi:hypothetical protein [Aureispira anguillae]|uniref:Uncharacterized protein n=1 Tax=Aureispira anguillae TaxID=2864201 RepID=A0A915VKI9_9BACT|nr:hypothetical protein [Aureispira anguillae]BDS09701.1 hypothetical protein AsAng_0004050 [Aureispira anguillae]
MKASSILFLLLMATMSLGQTVAKPNAQLLDTAIDQYLKEMNRHFGITPTQFIIETTDKTNYQAIKKKVGNTAIVVKTKKELQDYSRQKVGEAIGFFVIDVEKTGDKYTVDIMDDGIQCTLQDGNPNFSYDSVGIGRACILTFDGNFVFEHIDCLLLPSDPK